MAASTGTQEPITAVDILKRDGDWVYLDEAGAKRHPLYGIKGWAALLASLLVAGALLGLLVFVGAVVAVVFGAIEGVIVAALMAGASAYQLFVAARLWKMRDSFQRHYLILFMVSLVLTIVSFVVDPEGAMSSIASMVVMGLWLAYVFQSARINVTTRKRVSAGDALVREAIVDMDPRRPKSAQY
jgi:hypothetical protein